ncbi:thiol peroxidase [Kocuria koreensis]|jgi:thiol peroxidase|uniref:Thiol peroxidase n=1 Tax=Rothia koreensis TaxID=592378 RepID=A0A7K1LFT5_9MICC|nr:thiol peroxidase [Rothia koreensis]MUN53960.1 thiol peroxidase [Rothia koreensis]
MAEITFKGNPTQTSGELPETGTTPPAFTLAGTDLGEVTENDFEGQTIVLNIFPSVDTGVCAASVRKFNEEAAGLENVSVVCVSNDLPFALGRFCGAEGIDNVVTASGFRSTFGDDYGVRITDGPMEGLLARSVVVISPRGEVVHTQLVPEIGEEPDYDSAMAAARS